MPGGIGIGLGAASHRPGVTVQVAFATDPNTPGAASPVWTTLANRVLAIDCARTGRSDEQSLYQGGTATLMIRNADGAFNPVNASGPYYGQLLPDRPIRILATWAGITYPLWQGYVERWPQGWTDPTLGYSQIQCVDAFGPLNQIGLDSAYAAEILSDGPTVYYPLSEGSGATTAGNQSAVPFPPGQLVHTKQVNTATPGTADFGGTLDIVGAASQSGLSFTGTNNNHSTGTEDGYALVLPRLPIPWTGFTIEFWCQVAATPGQYSILFQAVSATKFGPLSGPFGVDLPGNITVYQNGVTGTSALRLVSPDGANWQDASIGFNLADGLLHHVALTYTPGTVKAYVDGQLYYSGVITSTSTATVTSFCQVGAAVVNAQTLPGAFPEDGRPLIGTIGHVAIYPSTLPIARIDAHYLAGLNGFTGELSGDRAERVLAYGGWLPALEQIEQGRSTMGPASGLAGTVLLSALQDVADSELGTLTVTADGLVDLRSRDDRMLKTTPTIVFGDQVAAEEIPYSFPGMLFDYDPTLVSNDVQVSRQTGPVAEAFDQTSNQRFFPRSKQLAMNVDTDDQTQQAADWVLGREKTPQLRAEVLTVNAGNINGLELTHVWPALLGLDLHDRGGIRHRPKGAPETDMDGFVEQLAHHIDASSQSFAWDVSVQLSPVLQEYGIWDDPTAGRTLWDSAVWAF